MKSRIDQREGQSARTARLTQRWASSPPHPLFGADGPCLIWGTSAWREGMAPFE